MNSSKAKQLIIELDQWDIDDIEFYDHMSDHDFEGEDYVCSRCNGAGCMKCEE
jgi:hypothetical protein